MLLENGNHAGFEWAVHSNGNGFRCGYVLIPDDHPWFGVDYDHPDLVGVNVHGGLTFARSEDMNNLGRKGWWVGFDCAHSMDSPDPELDGAHSYLKHSWSSHGVVRSQDYVVGECRKLCEIVAENK